MAVDIEPLLHKLSELAPRFGRAEEDLKAMVSRGRAQDYKGVMQNARLVLEALLRSLITEDLKQTPGKAMLDELVSKFRQQANAGLIPTNVLAHMGTVQAWGNLSAHDHAGSLGDSAVKVGSEEVVASLNSMVAILSWYAEKKGLLGAAALAPVPAAVRVAAPLPARASPFPRILGGLTLLAVLGGAAFFLTGRVPAGVKEPTAPPADRYAALDTVYSTRKEPVPPAACRGAEDPGALARSANDVQALSLIEAPSAEAAYLLARATHETFKRGSPALEKALGCPGFAAAQHLAGLVAIREQRLGEAQKHLETARQLAPGWLDNRLDLAGVLLNTEQLEAAAPEVEAIIRADADYAPAYLLRAKLKELDSDKTGALADICRAVRLGSGTAKRMAEGLECP